MAVRLRMTWPVPRHPLRITLPQGYILRSFQRGEEKQYIMLLNNKDLGEWTIQKVQSILGNPLSPQGIYFVTQDTFPIATACALDRSPNPKKRVGELGWLVVDYPHRGKGLGMIICSAVINHLLNYEYEEIYLLTDYWRYAAIKTYLKLGFEPMLNSDEDRFLWNNLNKKLAWGIPLSEKEFRR